MDTGQNWFGVKYIKLGTQMRMRTHNSYGALPPRDGRYISHRRMAITII